MSSVTICEMSPRDGLQFLGSAAAAPRLLPLDLKVELVETLRTAGLPYIEVGAFVSPKVTPQMADTDALCARLTPRTAASPSHSTRLAALVPNVRHYARFAATSLDTVALFVSASQAYAQANAHASVDQLLEWALQVADAARADGRRLRAHVSAVFQDIASGERASNLSVVLRLIERLFHCGCDCVSLADTNGDSHPGRVADVLDSVRNAFGLDRIAVHLHDRNGAGIANALAAYQVGVRIFDASVGGIGGSIKAAGLKDTVAAPSSHSPTSSCTGHQPRHRTPIIAGNIATEELVDMLHRMGAETGVNLDRLISAGEIIYRATRLTDDFSPPGKLLRERLGYGIDWRS